MFFKAFIGQERIKNQLVPLIAAACANQRCLPHMVLCGPPEMGKATLAHTIADEINRPLKEVYGADIKAPADFNITEQLGILLIRDVDMLGVESTRTLIAAITQHKIAIRIGEGPGTRTLDLPLPLFTVIGTASYASRIRPELRRWLIQYDFHSYTQPELSQLVVLIAGQNGYPIGTEAASLLADHCEGSAGNAQVLLKRIWDYCNLHGKEEIDYDIATECLAVFGLRETDGGETRLSIEERLLQMTGTQFETFVAEIFRKLGYVVEATRASADHGIDLLLRKGTSLEAVQCKRWNAPVGEPVIRDFYGACFAIGAQLGYLVTTSTFTNNARFFASGKPLRLVDLADLLGMIRSTGGL